MTTQQVPPLSHLSPVGRLWGVELQSQQPSPNHVEPVHIDYIFCISSLKAEDPGGVETGMIRSAPSSSTLRASQCGDSAHRPSPLFLLQHLGVETEVEAHALRPALFVTGGNGAEFAIPCLSTPVPALDLEG